MDNNDKISQTIKTKDSQGNDVDLCLLPNNFEVARRCDIEFRKAWTFALKEGIDTHDVLKDVFAAQGLWTEEHEKEFKETGVALQAHILLLEKYKKVKDMENGKKTALQLVDIRNKLMKMTERRQQPYLYSCEGVANEIRMEAYIAYAAVYADDHTKHYYKNYEDFKNRREEQAAIDLWSFYLRDMLGENVGHIEQLPENRFLIEVGYLTKDLKKAVRVNKGVKEALDKAKKLDNKNAKKKVKKVAKKKVAKKKKVVKKTKPKKK